MIFQAGMLCIPAFFILVAREGGILLHFGNVKI